MKPHDCESLNDIQCWHADHFAAQLQLWRARNLGDAICFRAARADAQRRFPLEPDESAVMDAYIESRFGVRKAERRPEGEAMPMMVVR